MSPVRPELIRESYQCASHDTSLGSFQTMEECADTCAAVGNCRFFSFGKGESAGQCHHEFTEAATCPEGFQKDTSYDFYRSGSDPGPELVRQGQECQCINAYLGTFQTLAQCARLQTDSDLPSGVQSMTVRSVFVIGPDKKIKLTMNYPASTGRNFDEILRVIDSLQLTAKHQVATPVNWKRGEDVIIVPAVTNEEAKTKFPDGWKEVRPYLRIVPQPK